MDQMINDIASMGGELFVMDDGWFGGKYRRINDNSSLGDWVVDTEKLPHGIKGLTDAAGKYGIKFGIWIEPEFTNTKSELANRNKMIYADYLSGISISRLAKKYYLAEKSIQRIIRQEKSQK